jgi:putative PIN family toxin of toxin-antitoxin system
MIRIVVDINIWVSYLLTHRFRSRCSRLFLQEYQLLVSEEFFQEFHSTITKPDLRRRLSEDDINDLRNNLYDKGVMIDIESVVQVCRDPDDDYLLALAQDGSADYLITRDEDLLSLKTFGKTEIITLHDLETIQHEHKEI